MSVLEQVRADSIGALKAGDRELVGALRMLVSELQKAAKEGGDDELAVLRRERKRRLEAAAQFEQAGRGELAAKERSEADLIGGYLPPELDDQQLATLVDEAVAATGATSVKELGAVMKVVLERAGGQVDGRRAAAAVRAALGE